MDPASALGAVFAAFGLSAAAGLNAWVPLLGAGLASRLGWVELDGAYDAIESTPALALLTLGLVVDFVGDKIPAVDHVLHAIGGVVQPVAGAILFAAQAGVTGDLDGTLALVLGALTAGSIHAGRAGVRPLSTAGTGGVGNPVLSLLEDIGAAGLTVLAFALPLVALAVAVALVVAAARYWRGLRRRLAGSSP